MSFEPGGELVRWGTTTKCSERFRERFRRTGDEPTHGMFATRVGLLYYLFYEVALLELETRARRTGRETSDCNSRERLGRALD